jgi:hypothetical protein
MKFSGEMIFLGYTERAKQDGTKYALPKFMSTENETIFDFYTTDGELMNVIEKLTRFQPYQLGFELSSYQGKVQVYLKIIRVISNTTPTPHNNTIKR